MSFTLLECGFDRSEPTADGYWRVGCSQCQALVVNGVATHEHGCPNAVHECHGCDALIPMGQRYCEECR